MTNPVPSSYPSGEKYAAATMPPISLRAG